MSEHALRGVSAAPGVASGQAVVLDRPRPRATKAVAPPARGREAERARAALESSGAELQEIASRLRASGRDDEATIVETGVLMAADSSLMKLVDSLVMESGLHAAAALARAADQIATDLANLGDPTLALRADDVRSLGRRAAAHAAGERAALAGGVLIAKSLGPADVAELNPTGIALVGGGVTAHAAIVARSLGIPMVVALGDDALAVEDGEEVILDGDAGLLVRHPAAMRMAAAREHGKHRLAARETARARRLEPAVTRDGKRITVLANAASVAEVIEAGEQGAEGVGLLRTELGFLDAHAWPSFEKQVAFLTPILARLAGQVATVRLLDFGGDKTPPFLRGATGRGIELLLEAPAQLTTQLAAILIAGAKTRLRILVPMVTSPLQVTAVREALEAALDGQPAPQVGSMIETPEAAHRADEIARVSDFLSLGTNDLTQLVLGLDREQSRTAPVTDLRVLRLIDVTMRAGHAGAVPVDVCGEAASDAIAMPIMIGMGADELSVAAARVGEVRQRIRDGEFATFRAESDKWLLGQPADTARKGR
ncbi:MAG TPA: putative PEP-binding protein [Candidatus Dormibacteraeota bacterium]|nr:putative PEP-binding protein [Candidatus Dormibacteraeota bacterium]